MSLKNVKGASLRRRLILGSTLAAGVISLIAGLLILGVAIPYHFAKANDRLSRATTDLVAEYDEYGGPGEAFYHCMDENALEGNPNLTFVLLVNDDGDAIRTTAMPDRIRDRILRNFAGGRTRHRFYTERDDDEDRHIAVRFLAHRLDDGNTIIVARDVTDDERFLLFLAITLGGSWLLIVVLSALHAAIFGTRFVKRLGDIGTVANAIESGDWGRRVDENARDAREIRQLTDAFNGMCEKNERTLAELRVLTDNIAHDLRTPLTRLALAAESDAAGAALSEPLGDLVAAETSAMLEMINTMLDISQTEAKLNRSPREEIDLAGLVRKTAELYGPLAEEEGLSLTLKVPPHAVPFFGHRARLQQLLGNLVDNAIKYTSRGGRIALGLTSSEAAVSLTVKDSGRGIAASDIPHIFKRFWRADTSRSLPGNGLGLALVQAIVTAYGGRIVCTSAPGEGTEMAVTLPL